MREHNEHTLRTMSKHDHIDRWTVIHHDNGLGDFRLHWLHLALHWRVRAIHVDHWRR